MERRGKILKCFDAQNELSVENEKYRDFTLRLFNFLLESDLGDGDASQFPSEAYKEKIECTVVVKEQGVVAGLDEVRYILKQFGIKTTTDFKDGDKAGIGKILLKLNGEAGRILALERTVLNILQRLCGIATMTAKYTARVNRENCFVIGTRKTLFGLWDKRAVRCGGGLSHRLNLEDAAMLKENHLNILKKYDRLDDLHEALEAVVQSNKSLRFIEVEVTNEEEFWQVLRQLLRIKEDIYKVIMFDHFTIHQIKTIINELQLKGIHDDILLEASGNIDLNSVSDFAQSGVDVISSGALTHSVKGLDLSLLFS